MRRYLWVLVALAALGAWTGQALAEVKLPAVFGSGMVLQREMKVPLWGTADAGEKVKVCFAGQTAETTAGTDGRWTVKLAPLAASAEGRTLTVSGKNEVKFEDVLVGEVWVCSGQSNMEMGIGACNVPDEIAKADWPQIRLFLVSKDTSPEPLADLRHPASWKPCSPKTIVEGGWSGFSAAGYFFGRELHQKLDVPVGLIGTYWGGTPAQAWTSKDKLVANRRLAGYLTRWDELTARYPEEQKKLPARLVAWKKEAEAAKTAGKQAPNMPRVQDPVTSPNRPANLFNAMIAPLVPYGIRGAIWYQGESNAGVLEAQLYRTLLAAMIADWRTRWAEGDFTFLIVQLANFMKRYEAPTESSWAVLRESQLKTLRVKNTGLAVAIDIGDAADIHPKDKLSVGKRLALAAEKVAYRRDVVYSGPVFSKMTTKGGKAILSFKHVGGGLVDKAEGGLKGFAIAGADKNFVWADAKIEGHKVVVSSPEVKKPVAVRYGWADNPEVSLYNKEGLPATPFRTDTWTPPAWMPSKK